MEILIYIIVLIFEIFYYSLFMKFAKNDNKFWKYLLVFIIVNFILFFVGSLNIYAYLIFMILSVIGMKKIGKTSLYDMFVIFVMLLFKLGLELCIALPMSLILTNINLCKIIIGIIKVLVVLGIKNKINSLYNKFKIYWNNNNFYIRYLFSILMFIYAISACLFLMKFS